MSLADASTDVPAPLGLLAELTHRCPLACPYCSNPLALDDRSDELDAATWGRVFREAAAMGVLQVHLSGGEPAARRDLGEIVALARDAELYTNLIKYFDKGQCYSFVPIIKRACASHPKKNFR